MELLAPAGSYKALIAAIYSGANAVYLGMDKFNARAKADNFNEDNIKDVVSLCHLHNVKVYVTFNTLIKDSEFDEFEKQVDIAAKANVDAFLVTDFGTIPTFKKYDIPMHASTQMGIHNYEGAKIAKELGFTRVVLSREALKEDVIKIKTLGLEIEYFVHGALCVAFSGGCLLSSYMSGDSGNRGLCKQPCRLCYTSTLTGKDKYYLSPSDQCFIDEIKELESWGVDSLKIEGRLKAPHYVGEVVRQYRLALDGKKDPNYLEKLRRAYNRGSFTKGYNFDKTKDIMSINVQGNIGEEVGEIVSSAKNTLYIKTTKPLNLKDGVKVLYNNAEVGGFLIDNIKYENGLCVIKTLKVYPAGSKVFLTLDNNMVQEYENPDIHLPLKIQFFANEGKSFKVIAQSGTSKIEKLFDVVDVASKSPVSKEMIISKLSELGETNFRIEKIDGEVSSNAFYPMSKLKQIKRDIVDEITKQIFDDYDSNKQRCKYENTQINLGDIELKNILVEIDKDVDFDVDFSKVDLVLKNNDFSQNIMKNWLIYNKIDKYLLKLPRILRGKDVLAIDNFIDNDPKIKGIIVENIGGIEIARRHNLPCIFGANMNLLNSRNLSIFTTKNFVQSTELSLNESIKNSYTYACGYIDLMTFTHCPIQLNTGCNCSDCKYDGEFSYINRDNEYRVIRTKISHCYFNLISPKVLDLRSLSLKKVYVSLSNIKDIDSNLICDIINNRQAFEQKAYLGHAYLPIK